MNAFAAPPRSAAATVGTKNPRAVKQLGLFLSLHSSIPSWVSSTGGEQETFASLAAHYLIRHLSFPSQPLPERRACGSEHAAGRSTQRADEEEAEDLGRSSVVTEASISGSGWLEGEGGEGKREARLS